MPVLRKLTDEKTIKSLENDRVDGYKTLRSFTKEQKKRYRTIRSDYLNAQFESMKERM